MQTVVPACRPRPMSATTASRIRQSMRTASSTISGGTAITRSGPVGDGRRRVRDGAQPARGDELGQGVLEPRLTGERLVPLVDEVHDPLVDVAADDLVPSTGDGDSEGQPDLAERDDDDAHQPAVASATGRTVSPLAAASSTASA